jgi:hypothetical protein
VVDSHSHRTRGRKTVPGRATHHKPGLQAPSDDVALGVWRQEGHELERDTADARDDVQGRTHHVQHNVPALKVGGDGLPSPQASIAPRVPPPQHRLRSLGGGRRWGGGGRGQQGRGGVRMTRGSVGRDGEGGTEMQGNKGEKRGGGVWRCTQSPGARMPVLGDVPCMGVDGVEGVEGGAWHCPQCLTHRHQERKPTGRQLRVRGCNHNGLHVAVPTHPKEPRGQAHTHTILTQYTHAQYTDGHTHIQNAHTTQTSLCLSLTEGGNPAAVPTVRPPNWTHQGPGETRNTVLQGQYSQVEEAGDEEDERGGHGGIRGGDLGKGGVGVAAVP